jgi:hypothetical protein
MRTSCERVRTPVFENNCWRTAFTSGSETPSLKAISLLVWPEHLALAGGERSRLIRSGHAERFRHGWRSRRGSGLARDLADALDQNLGALLLEDDAGASTFHQAAGLEPADAGGHHEDFACEPGGSRQRQECPALLQAEVDIEQDDIHGGTSQHRDAFVDGGTLAYDLEIRLTP